MPIYDYDCPKCGSKEVFMNMSTYALVDGLAVCPDCNSEMERRIKPTAITGLMFERNRSRIDPEEDVAYFTRKYGKDWANAEDMLQKRKNPRGLRRRDKKTG